MPGPLRLMAVHAHPDDESSKGAASAARYVREGISVLVVTCTGGERGDVLNPGLDLTHTPDGLAVLRRLEMARAAEILAVDHTWLGFEDSGYPEGDPKPPLPQGCFAQLPLAVATAPLTALIRSYRPHVVTTYDEHGGYPHPDHIRTHEVTIAAIEDAARPASDGVVGWQVSKLYYHMTFHKPKLVALHEAALASGIDSPYEEWLANWEDRPHDADRVTTRVPCAEFFGLRDDALRAHASQIDPAGRWFSLPLDLQAQVWPTEDYQLARAWIPATVPEDDLFSGLRNAESES
ncbi:MAG: mycothiol conjugate amidase Mca [Actinomycetes bacterium]